MTASTAPPEGSFLATGRGKVTLALLCAVTFLDVVDGSIVNVALPTIRTHLGFPVQNLQWVVSGDQARAPRTVAGQAGTRDRGTAHV